MVHAADDDRGVATSVVAVEADIAFVDVPLELIELLDQAVPILCRFRSIQCRTILAALAVDRPGDIPHRPVHHQGIRVGLIVAHLGIPSPRSIDDSVVVLTRGALLHVEGRVVWF